MVASTDAIYRNGVLVPATPLDLHENDRVRITIEPLPPTAGNDWSKGLAAIRARAQHRLSGDPQLAAEIALDHDLDLNNL